MNSNSSKQQKTMMYIEKSGFFRKHNLSKWVKVKAGYKRECWDCGKYVIVDWLGNSHGDLTIICPITKRSEHNESS